MKNINIFFFILFLQTCTENLLLTSDSDSNSDSDESTHSANLLLNSFAYSHSGTVETDIWRGEQRKAFLLLPPSYTHKLIMLKHQKNLSSSQGFENGFDEGFKLGYASGDLRRAKDLKHATAKWVDLTTKHEDDLRRARTEHQAALRQIHEQLRSYTDVTGSGHQKIKDKAFRQGIQEGVLLERRQNTDNLMAICAASVSIVVLGCTIS